MVEYLQSLLDRSESDPRITVFQHSMGDDDNAKSCTYGTVYGLVGVSTEGIVLHQGWNDLTTLIPWGHVVRVEIP